MTKDDWMNMVQELHHTICALHGKIADLQFQVKVRNVLLDDSRNQLKATHVWAASIEGKLSQVTKIKPDPACTACKGFGTTEYMAHGDLHFGDCKCTYPRRLGLT